MVFGSIDNTSGDDQGYGDFTNVSTTFVQGASAEIMLYPGFAFDEYQEHWKVWIDYNQDGDFEDAGELIGEGNSTSMASGMMSISATATPGTTRMRVSMRYNTPPESSCGTFDWGEVEDYSIVITAADNLFPTASNRSSQLEGENTNMGLGLFPNPATDEVNLTYLAREEGEAELQILDLTGKMILNQKENARKGRNVFRLNTAQLPSGIYLVRLNVGEFQVAEKLTISK